MKDAARSSTFHLSLALQAAAIVLKAKTTTKNKNRYLNEGVHILENRSNTHKYNGNTLQILYHVRRNMWKSVKRAAAM